MLVFKSSSLPLPVLAIAVALAGSAANTIGPRAAAVVQAQAAGKVPTVAPRGQSNRRQHGFGGVYVVTRRLDLARLAPEDFGDQDGANR